MDRPSELGDFRTGQKKRLQELADQLEQAWRAHAPNDAAVDLRQLLPLPTDSLYLEALQHLVAIDLRLRWQRGDQVCLEHYLRQFPELGSMHTLPPQLIYEEYHVRLDHGDDPQLDTYRSRFPGQFENFQHLVNEKPYPTRSDPHAPTDAPSDANKLTPKPMASRLPPGAREECGYLLTGFIGRGAFGEVWLAQAAGGIPAAVKIIRRDHDHEREAQLEQQALDTIKHLRHIHLLQTQAYWSLPDRLVIAMELADGSLRDRLRQCREDGHTGIRPAELITYFREAAEALDYLHSRQLLHRDVKPDNLLLVSGHVKVADFGLVRVLPTDRSLSLTENGVGTPPYMAPEVWHRKYGKVSKFSDQYSLAAAYAELRMGHMLFRGNIGQIMLAHLEQQPQLETLPEVEQRVLLRALAKDPQVRYPTCKAFAKALEQTATVEFVLDEELPVMDLPPSPPQSKSPAAWPNDDDDVEDPAFLVSEAWPESPVDEPQATPTLPPPVKIPSPSPVVPAPPAPGSKPAGSEKKPAAPVPSVPAIPAPAPSVERQPSQPSRPPIPAPPPPPVKRPPAPKPPDVAAPAPAPAPPTPPPPRPVPKKPVRTGPGVIERFLRTVKTRVASAGRTVGKKASACFGAVWYVLITRALFVPALGKWLGRGVGKMLAFLWRQVQHVAYGVRDGLAFVLARTKRLARGLRDGVAFLLLQGKRVGGGVRRSALAVWWGLAGGVRRCVRAVLQMFTGGARFVGVRKLAAGVLTAAVAVVLGVAIRSAREDLRGRTETLLGQKKYVDAVEAIKSRNPLALFIHTQLRADANAQWQGHIREHLMREGQYPEAAAQCKLMQEAFEDDQADEPARTDLLAAWRGSADDLLKQEKYPEAQVVCDDIERHFPGTDTQSQLRRIQRHTLPGRVKDLLAQAREADGKERYDDARKLYDEATKLIQGSLLEDNDKAAQLLLVLETWVVALPEREGFEEALKQLAGSKLPDDKKAAHREAILAKWVATAEAEAAKGGPDKARLVADAILKADPGNARATVLVIQDLCRLQKYREALATLEKIRGGLPEQGADLDKQIREGDAALAQSLLKDARSLLRDGKYGKLLEFVDNGQKPLIETGGAKRLRELVDKDLPAQIQQRAEELTKGLEFGKAAELLKAWGKQLTAEAAQALWAKLRADLRADLLKQINKHVDDHKYAEVLPLVDKWKEVLTAEEDAELRLMIRSKLLDLARQELAKDNRDEADLICQAVLAMPDGEAQVKKLKEHYPSAKVITERLEVLAGLPASERKQVLAACQELRRLPGLKTYPDLLARVLLEQARAQAPDGQQDADLTLDELKKDPKYAKKAAAYGLAFPLLVGGDPTEAGAEVLRARLKVLRRLKEGKGLAELEPADRTAVKEQEQKIVKRLVTDIQGRQKRSQADLDLAREIQACDPDYPGLNDLIRQIAIVVGEPKLLLQKLKDGVPAERVRILDLLPTVLKDNGSLLGQTLSTLEELSTMPLTPGEQKAVTAAYGRLASENAKQIVLELIAPRGRREWEARGHACEMAGDKSEWGRLGQAECLLEKRGSRPLSTDVEYAGRLANAPLALEETKGYAFYVQALVLRWSDRLPDPAHPADAARILMRAFKGVNVAEWLRTDRRKQRAIEILSGGAREQFKPDRDQANGNSPFGTAAVADEVYLWLEKARELAAEMKQLMDSESLTILALAAWHRPDRKPERAGDLSAELTKKLPDAVDPVTYKLLLIDARARKTAVQQLQAYSMIRELAQNERLNISAPVLNREVLQPACELGEKELGSNPVLAPQVASLYGSMGKLLRENAYKWPQEFQAPQKACDAFRRASKLDPGKAKYLVELAYAQSELPNPNWEELNGMAAEALKRERDYYDAYGLEGYIWHLRARQEPDRDKCENYLRHAIKAYGESIERIDQQGNREGQVHIVLTNRCSANVELANAIAEPNEQEKMLQQKKLLDDARKDGERATAKRSSYTTAWVALGMALEDLASILEENPKENYEKAIAAFRRAIQNREDSAAYRISLGRCYYKRGRVGKRYNKDLDQAIIYLEEALKRNPKASEKAETHYWLGNVYKARGEYEAAESNFEQAVELVTQGRSYHSTDYRQDWAQLALDQVASRRRSNPQDPQIAVLLRQARERAESFKQHNPSKAVEILARADAVEGGIALDHLEKSDDERGAGGYLALARRCAKSLENLDHPAEAAFLRGRALELEGEPEKALNAYTAGLAKEELLHDKKTHVELLSNRVYLYVAKEQGGPAPQSVIEEAEKAVRLAEKMRDDEVKAEAVGASGMALSWVAHMAGGKPADRTKGIQRLNNALELAPKSPRAWSWRLGLGVNYREEGNKEEALKQFEAAHDAAPKKFRERIKDMIREYRDK